ncbi:MAG: TonB-dependent receptor [Bacteroidia bacterium]|nr:TonB-dependent receptor [Bacteroidia bacterium]
MKPFCFKAIFLFFGLNLFAFTLLKAQSEYVVQIKITDSLSQEPLAYATVSMDKQRQSFLSNEQGFLSIPHLKAGTYVLHVSFVGYHHHDIILDIPKQLNYHVELCPEAFHLHESLVQAEGNKAVFSGRQQQVLDATEISKRSGQNLAELLKNINGVKAMNSAGGIAKPVIRGLSGQRLVVMQGNARLEGQQWGDDHGPELDPFMANSVAVIKGAAAVEFGPEAMGGVIRVEPKPWRKDVGTEGTLNLQGFSNNRQGAASLRLESVYGKKTQWGWRTQATLRKAGDARSAIYNLSNTGFNEQAFQASTFVGTKRWKLETTFSYFATEQGILQASHLGNFNDLQRALRAEKPLIILPFTYQVNRPFQQVSHVLSSSMFSYQLNSKTDIKINYTQQVNRRQEFDADRIYNQALQGRAAMDLEIQTLQAEQLIERKWRGHWLAKVGSSQSYQFNTTQGLQFIIPSFISQSLGAFALLKYYNENSSLSLGLRHDWRSLEVPTFQRLSRRYSYQRYFSGFNAGLTYLRNSPKWGQHTISLQSAWRPPAVNELYSYGLHYGLANFEIGDSNLVPERAWLLDWNVKKVWRNWHIDAGVYGQLFRNFIYRLPSATPMLTIRGAFPAFQFTQSQVLIAGFDASIAYKPLLAWQWESRFSQLYAQDLDLNRALIFMPANSMEHSVAYVWGDRKKLRSPYAELRSVWVARQHRFVPGLDFIDPPAAYVLLNLNVGFSYVLHPKWKAWNVHMSVNNLLNKSYRDYLSRFRYFTDDPGVNFIIRLQIPF